MFKRLFWLSTGLTIGFGSSVWVMRALRRTVERLTPQRLTHDAVAGARSVGTELKAALDEGREAMREREAELRAEIGRRSILRAQSD
jgi:hypothetical protein